MKKIINLILVFLIVSGCELVESNRSEDSVLTFFEKVTENIIAPFDFAYSLFSVERRITKYYESAGYLCGNDLICIKVEHDNDGERHKITSNSFDVSTMTYSTSTSIMKSEHTNVFEFAISLSSGNGGYQVQHISYVGMGHGVSRYTKNLITNETDFYRTEDPTITLSEESLIGYYNTYEYLFSLMLKATMNLTIEEYLLKNTVGSS